MDESKPGAVHEAGLLHLSTDKAAALLEWRPVWKFPEAIAKTVAWYRQALTLKSALEFQKKTHSQIEDYITQATALKLPWAIRL